MSTLHELQVAQNIFNNQARKTLEKAILPASLDTVDDQIKEVVTILTTTVPLGLIDTNRAFKAIQRLEQILQGHLDVLNGIAGISDSPETAPEEVDSDLGFSILENINRVEEVDDLEKSSGELYIGYRKRGVPKSRYDGNALLKIVNAGHPKTRVIIYGNKGRRHNSTLGAVTKSQPIKKITTPDGVFLGRVVRQELNQVWFNPLLVNCSEVLTLSQETIMDDILDGNCTDVPITWSREPQPQTVFQRLREEYLESHPRKPSLVAAETALLEDSPVSDDLPIGWCGQPVPRARYEADVVLARLGKISDSTRIVTYTGRGHTKKYSTLGDTTSNERPLMIFNTVRGTFVGVLVSSNVFMVKFRPLWMKASSNELVSLSLTELDLEWAQGYTRGLKLPF